MKYRPVQDPNHGTQTTYVFESLNEVLAMVMASELYKKNKFHLDNDRRQIADSFPDIKGDVKKINPKARFDLEMFKGTWRVENYQKSFDECVQNILDGKIPGYPTVVEEAKALADELKDLVLNLEPSLRLDQSWTQVEQSDVWDPGAIAAGEEKPCFQKNKEEKETKVGAGDGAFRIVINTDVYCGGNPCFQAATMAALVDILQGKAPVEIWVQQGWIGHGAENGVTLFPVHRGGAFDLSKVVFWIAHPGKDSPFSFVISRVLGRRCSGVSEASELPCDLYVYSLLAPLAEKDKAAYAEWIKATARKMLFEEEDPQNW